MTLTEQLTDYVHAAFSGVYVITREAEEAEREIAPLARQRKWKLAVWDVASGLRVLSQPGTFRGDAQPGATPSASSSGPMNPGGKSSAMRTYLSRR